MNLRQFFDGRPLSWSSLSSFEYDPEGWYRKYILGQKDPDTKELIFGKAFAKSIEDGTCVVPGLLEALAKKKEQGFSIVFQGIKMVGFADAFDDTTLKVIDEVKTGKKAWDQKRVDDHGQITLYALFNFVTNKIRPEDTKFALYWVPTEENGKFEIDFVKPVRFIQFDTKRTTLDIIKFGQYILSTVDRMQAFCDAKDLSTGK